MRAAGRAQGDAADRAPADAPADGQPRPPRKSTTPTGSTARRIQTAQPPKFIGDQGQQVLRPGAQVGQQRPHPLVPYVDFKHLKTRLGLVEIPGPQEESSWGDGKDVQTLERLAMSALTHGLTKEFHDDGRLKKVAPRSPPSSLPETPGSTSRRPPPAKTRSRRLLGRPPRQGRLSHPRSATRATTSSSTRTAPTSPRHRSNAARHASKKPSPTSTTGSPCRNKRAGAPHAPVSPARHRRAPAEFAKRQRDSGLGHQPDRRLHAPPRKPRRPLDQALRRKLPLRRKNLLPVRQQLLLFPDRAASRAACGNAPRPARTTSRSPPCRC